MDAKTKMKQAAATQKVKAAPKLKPAAKKRAISLLAAGSITLVACFCVLVWRSETGELFTADSCTAAVPHSNRGVALPCEADEGEACAYECQPGFEATGAHICSSGAFFGGGCEPCRSGHFSPGGRWFAGGELDAAQESGALVAGCQACGECLGAEVFAGCSPEADAVCVAWASSDDADQALTTSPYLAGGSEPGLRRDGTAWEVDGDLFMFGGSLPFSGARAAADGGESIAHGNHWALHGDPMLSGEWKQLAAERGVTQEQLDQVRKMPSWTRSWANSSLS